MLSAAEKKNKAHQRTATNTRIELILFDTMAWPSATRSLFTIRVAPHHVWHNYCEPALMTHDPIIARSYIAILRVLELFFLLFIFYIPQRHSVTSPGLLWYSQGSEWTILPIVYMYMMLHVHVHACTFPRTVYRQNSELIWLNIGIHAHHRILNWNGRMRFPKTGQSTHLWPLSIDVVQCLL